MDSVDSRRLSKYSTMYCEYSDKPLFEECDQFKYFIKHFEED